MKIILCTFLLCITTVSVFGEPQKLNRNLGESVKFPAEVKKDGFLMYSGVTIGDVNSGIFRTPRNKRFNGRVQWDSSTGFFSLSGLKMEDIGEYEVQNTDQNINTVFQLNMHMSVFGEPQELNRIVGQSVKFPAAVKKDGSLMYSGIFIGTVSGSFTPSDNDKYSGRVQWDSSTGFFSLSGLKMEDSGEYKVQNTDQNITTVFQLNVYKVNVPVSKPHVSVTGDKYPCKLNCTVERGTGVTLYWYKEGEKESISSSSIHSAPDLHQSVRVERSGIYTCEARNSVSNETSDPLTVGAHCTGGAAGIWKTDGSKMWSLYLVLIVMLCSRLV